MKTIDEREMQKTTKEKQAKTERSKENRSYIVRAWESFKVTTSFANIAKTTASTRKFIYWKCFKSLGIGSLYEKEYLIFNELKTSLMWNFSLQNSLQSFKSFILIWCERLPIYGNL